MAGGSHHVLGGERRVAVAEDQTRRRRLLGRGPTQVDPSEGDESGRRVRAMTAGVHADRASDRAGHADCPLETAEAGSRRPAGEHGQAHGRTGDHLGPPDGDLLEPGTEGDGQPGEAAVGDEQVGAAPEDEHGHGRAGPTVGAGHGQKLVLVRGFGHEASDTPHPVGGAGAERLVAGGETAEGPGESVERRRRRPHCRHPSSSARSSSGIEVRSPAPKVRQRSPGWSSSDTNRTSSAREAT